MTDHGTINHGPHDSLVWQALVRMLVPVEHRARTQLAEFFARANVTAHEDEHGVHVSPSKLRALIEQLDAEADRLFELDDPIAPAFAAWSESARLAHLAWEMDPENVD